MSKSRKVQVRRDNAPLNSAAVDDTVLPITHHSSPITPFNCFHCGEPIPENVRIHANVGCREEAVCCHGCRAVAELIAGAGLLDYYRFRDAPAQRVDETDSEWTNYDQPELLAQLSQVEADGMRSAILLLDGIGCAACGWLIDRMLKREQGICSVNVNAATARMRVRWNPNAVPFSRILQRIADFGFTPHPISSRTIGEAARDERRAALRRLIVAGLGMMQVMMFAVALYASDFGAPANAMEPQVRAYLRYVSLLCATPVLFYAGVPFLIGAWRAVCARVVTMDVPVSIGLVLAYVASIWNTQQNSGNVYFDSVTMFVFFLTLSRFVEMTARHRTGDVTEALARLLPLIAHRVRSSQNSGESEIEDVPVAALRVDDELMVRCGETVPADGRIVDGASRFDESMLTGESIPTLRGVHSAISAGTMNLQTPVRMRVTAIGNGTVLSGIVRLLQRAEYGKTPQATAADRAASWFLRRILVGAGVVAAIWLAVDPSRALSATLAVLVVTCPCALSLALPTALAAATNALTRRGVLVTQSAALENLASVTHVIFDKTGTLTHGQPTIDRCEVLGDRSERECRDIVFALERSSEHPIANAFRIFGGFVASDVQVVPGSGLEGIVNGERYRVGHRDFVQAIVDTDALLHDTDDTSIYLGDNKQTLASFRLADKLRDEAREVVADLQGRKLTCEILSGDAWVSVARAAEGCGITQFTARQTPADKLQHVRERIASGASVAMIGDGVNDAPVLKGASVSIAMGRASALAQVCADIVLIGDSLQALPAAFDIARRTRRIVKQNLAWAAAYNLLALPLAALGFVPPWLAAIGMSASSIVVVMNALRLAPMGKIETARHRDAARATDPGASILRTPDLTLPRTL